MKNPKFFLIRDSPSWPHIHTGTICSWADWILVIVILLAAKKTGKRILPRSSFSDQRQLLGIQSSRKLLL